MTEQTKAGWYPRPDMQNTLGFWDGAAWTDQTAPGGAAGEPADDRQHASNLVLAGLVLAAVFPVAGFVVGVVLLAKRQVLGGVVIMLLALGATLWWYDALAG